MPKLDVSLLGGFQITYNDQEVKTLQAERLILLVSYLHLNSEKPILRKQLAFTFWTDTTEEQARTNLRNLFHHLRKAFPEIDSFLETDGQSIQWKADPPIESDVTQFHAALRQAKRAENDPARIQYLQQAIHIYRGELLPGYYEDWLLTRREELHQAYLTALSQLAKLLEDSRQYEDAIEITNRLIRSEPLNESAYQLSMRLHALNQDRAGALQAYHACVTAMRRELDMEPSVEIQALYEQLVRSSETPSMLGEKGKATAEVKLVGRKQEWAQLKEAWHFIQKNQAHMILLRGESGIGKTRLAEELTVWVQRQGFFTAVARAYPAEGELAYGAVTLWLRSLSMAHLPDVWKTEVSRLMPELLEAKISQPGALSEAWQQQRFHEGLARAALGSQPLLLLLDDIQWADRKSLEWLRFLFRFDPQARFMLLATARNEDLAPESPASALIESLRQTAQYTEISIERFRENETRMLAEQISQNKLTEESAAAIQKQTEGLPLFIIELTRSGLQLEEASPASLPDRLLVALKERLSSLTILSRNAAEAAAVIGRDFSANLLAHVTELNEADLLSVLDELWVRHILREGERGRYDFSHDKLREYIYTSLSPARKQALHRRVAMALSDLEPDDLWGNALHLEKSGALREAAEVYFRAAKREADQAAYSAAQTGLTHAISLLDAPAVQTRAEMLVELAKVCNITGEQELASQAAEETLQLTAKVKHPLLRSQALTAAANIAVSKGQLDDARTWFEMALEAVKPLEDKTHEIQLLSQMADVELLAGKAQECRGWYEQALELARQTKNHALEANALMDLGFLMPAIGESMALAKTYIEASTKLRRMLGDKLGEARSLGNLVAFLHAYGAYEEALLLGDEALEKNRAINYRRGAAIIESAQGLAAYELGQFEQARTLIQHSREEYVAIGEQDGYGLHTGSLGLVAMAEGKFEESEILFKEGLTIAEEHQTEIFAAMHNQDMGTLYSMQNRWEEARPLFEKALAINLENNDNLGILYDRTMLGQVHFHAGDTVYAGELADEVLEKFRAESFEEGGVFRWLWQFKRLLEALGREEDAAEVLVKAKGLFQASVGKIQKEDLRQSFMENFPHHREFL
jgi:DNA-binding SARP family transcriptional activator/tetratricopeptide (TPR) repeat protein